MSENPKASDAVLKELNEEHERLVKSYEMLRKANDLQNKLIDSVGSGIFSYTLPERHVLLLNSEARRLFDCSESSSEFDFMNMVSTKILPEDAQKILHASRQMKEPGDSMEYEFRIRKDRGEMLIVKCNSRLLAFSDGQKYILSAMQDITRQRKLEEALDEERWAIINSYSSIYFASWIVDLAADKLTEVKVPECVQGITTETGGKIKAGFRYLTEHFIVDEFLEDVEEFLNIDTLKARIRGKETIALEYRSKIEGWCRASFIPVENIPDKFILAVQDINEKKSREEETRIALQQAYETARNANRAKTDFLAKISHDIRTPMNAIIGMTAIAEEHVEDKERVINYLEKIAVSGRHLIHLVNEVLDMTKIESGQMELAEERFNLSAALDEMLIIAKTQAEEKQQEFLVSSDNVKHTEVLGDNQKLQQVLLNLLGNAIKYTPEGGKIEFVVTEKPLGDSDMGCYEFTVKDNGIGMSEEFMVNLFDPFVRADDSRVAHVQGAGLGMSIAKNIVQAMNGTIAVQSRLDQGTKFTVVVYLKLWEEEKPEEDSTAPERAGGTLKEVRKGNFSGKRGLLVEDNELNAEIATEILGMTGMEVEFAGDGKQALDMVAASEDGYYDIIFMDIRMPVMDGFASARAIRGLGREYTDQVPIVAMTADAFISDVQACIDAGMNAHIAKPLDFIQLANILDRWLTK